eukprot:TRINITY_DN32462_c0_g1_i1.p3 TRINITY_DN32462_c0_g1~~TRINITY_DN32462_c0_g1_i1.p3  ORF type:complete len:129 (+),score=49.55 TRINITY_DN32462_c0_g1_i1:220-606(+)
MFASLRLLVRASHVGEAAEIGPAAVIVRVLKQHGELDKNKIWEFCEEAGVKSKRQMKLTLGWLKEKQHINVVCHRRDPAARSEEERRQQQMLAGRRGQKGKAAAADDRVFTYRLAPRYLPQQPQPLEG